MNTREVKYHEISTLLISVRPLCWENDVFRNPVLHLTSFTACQQIQVFNSFSVLTPTEQCIQSDGSVLSNKDLRKRQRQEVGGRQGGRERGMEKKGKHRNSTGIRRERKSKREAGRNRNRK